MRRSTSCEAKLAPLRGAVNRAKFRWSELRSDHRATFVLTLRVEDSVRLLSSSFSHSSDRRLLVSNDDGSIVENEGNSTLRSDHRLLSRQPSGLKTTLV
jgi:hypothetical protein